MSHEVKSLLLSKEFVGFEGSLHGCNRTGCSSVRAALRQGSVATILNIARTPEGAAQRALYIVFFLTVENPQNLQTDFDV